MNNVIIKFEKYIDSILLFYVLKGLDIENTSILLDINYCFGHKYYVTIKNKEIIEIFTDSENIKVNFDLSNENEIDLVIKYYFNLKKIPSYKPKKLIYE